MLSAQTADDRHRALTDAIDNGREIAEFRLSGRR